MSKNMKNAEGGKLKDILSGFFGASAILIVPSFINLTKPIIGEYVKNIYGFMIIWILPAIIITNLYEFSFINPLQFILNIFGFLVVYNIISISMILYFYPKVKLTQFLFKRPLK